MRRYSLYLFDFDNTLFDTSAGIEAILMRALPAVGVGYTPSLFQGTLGLSMDQVFDKYVGDPALYDTYTDEFMKVVQSDAYLTAKPFPETREVLEELVRRGAHIGIVSGKKRYKIERLMGDWGMGDIPEFIVGFDDTERHKPHPDPIQKALDFFGIPLNNVLYVGDSPNDPAAAKAAGIDCAVVNRHDGSTPDGLPCTYEVGSLTGILDC